MRKLKTLSITLLFLLLLTSCVQPEYTITLHHNDEFDTISTIIHGEDTPVPYNSGFTFVGWFIDSDLEHVYERSTEISENTNIYAKWEEITFTITYEIIGDILPSSTTETITFNQTFELKEVLHDEYDFSGWFIDENFTTLASNLNPLENTTFYGRYEESIVVEIPVYDIALVIGADVINDDAYNADTLSGIRQFAEEYNYTFNYYRSLSPTHEQYMRTVDIAIEEGAKVVVFPGYLFETVCHEAQFKYPNVTFILLDGTPHNIIDFNSSTTYDDEPQNYTISDNTASVMFNEIEAGFLAGYAAVLDGYRNLGFIGGYPLPAIKNYGLGFVAGAYYAAEELNVEITLTDNTYMYSNVFWPDPIALDMAIDMYESGVEIIFTCSGGANASVVFAAEYYDGKVIGSDVDMSSYSNSVTTSATKNFGSITYLLLKDIFIDEDFTDGLIIAGVDYDGVGIEFENGRFTNSFEAEYNLLISNIINGSIIIPEDYDELVVFLGDNASNFTEENLNGIN